MIAYFDCFSGISGDMTLGALLDVGLPIDCLNDMIQQLKIQNTVIEKKIQTYMGIRATQAVVHTQASPMRHYSDICEMIHKSSLSHGVKTKSLAMFQRLAEVEAKIHGCDVAHVHFHEVGAVDSIVDIVGTACGLEALGIEHVVFSALPMGTGFVHCQHGCLPIPAPATLNVLENVPIYGTQIPYELVTPTGALFAACLAEQYGPLPPMYIKQTGYGAGSRQLEEQPNLLRIILGKSEFTEVNSNTICESIGVIETHVDDMTPECLSYVMSLLMESGALDVLFYPMYMKKNRMGTGIQVICLPNDIQRLTDMLLQESSTIGVRYHVVQRKALVREITAVQTSLGEIQAKKIVRPDGTVGLTPEYDCCQRLAKEKKISIQRVYEIFFRDSL
ncbi:MAG: nickel pincer cofactor biosynthesis protein LarC [Candidatus Magnetomorum sp.]|nr:nickel pincer cofactor biosynthesis protein LarC [Candidatus Magnetomorum sp.]